MKFLKPWFCLIYFLLCLPVFVYAQTVQKPNIVVIMVDDLDMDTMNELMRLGDLGMKYLNQHVITKGFTFNESFVTNSLCCPSRTTFLTGQYSHNHKVFTNLPNNPLNPAVPVGGIQAFNDQSTLATWLKAGGYRTAMIGKYLNGYGGKDVDADRDGNFDLDDLKYVPPGWDDWQVLLEQSMKMYNFWINDKGTIIKYDESPRNLLYQTDELARRADAFIRGTETPNDNQPFFLALMPSAPHLEVNPFKIFTYKDYWEWDITPPLRYKDKLPRVLPLAITSKNSWNESNVSDKPAWIMNKSQLSSTDYFYLKRQFAHRLEAMRAVDDMVGTVVKALVETGEWERTVIMFTSDNGFMNGEHRLTQKMQPYEESIRVPLYVRLPSSQSKVVFNQVVTNNDLAPTILELAGVTAGLPVDGKSYVPLFSNPQESNWRQRFLIEHYKFTEYVLELPTFKALRTSKSNSLGEALLVDYEGKDISEFYDLAIDRTQELNRFSQLTMDKKDKFLKALTALKTCGNGTCQQLEFCATGTCPGGF